MTSGEHDVLIRLHLSILFAQGDYDRIRRIVADLDKGLAAIPAPAQARSGSAVPIVPERADSPRRVIHFGPYHDAKRREAIPEGGHA